MALAPTPGAARLIQGYYWLTPVFIFASWQLGVDVRVPFLDVLPGARAGYYVLSLACAALVTGRPGITSAVGRMESSLSIALLVITTWLSYFNAIEVAASGSAGFRNPFTPETVTSLLLSAGIFTASYVVQRIPVNHQAA